MYLWMLRHSQLSDCGIGRLVQRTLTGQASLSFFALSVSNHDVVKNKRVYSSIVQTKDAMTESTNAKHDVLPLRVNPFVVSHLPKSIEWRRSHLFHPPPTKWARQVWMALGVALHLSFPSGAWANGQDWSPGGISGYGL